MSFQKYFGGLVGKTNQTEYTSTATLQQIKKQRNNNQPD